MAEPAGVVSVGDELTLTIDRPAHGGQFIAVHEGRVVFISGVLPGETVRARVTGVKKRFLNAAVVEVMEPSPRRVPQRCQAAAAGAGCCDWGHMDAAAEQDISRAVVADCLRRLGHLEEFPELTYRELLPTSGWRTRVRLGVDTAGAAGMKAPQSTTVVGGVPCAQTHPLIQQAVDEHGPYSPQSSVVGAVDSAGQVALVEVSQPSRGRRATTTRAHLCGPKTLSQHVAGTDFELSPTAFWQGHSDAPREYCERIVEWLDPWIGEAAREGTPLVAWDLYGGVGVFAAAIARACDAAGVADTTVHLVDVATGTGRPHPRVVPHTCAVEAKVPQLPSPDVVVLDPPRKGAGLDVVKAVAAAGSRAVIHVGCDPATFARDLGYWVECGYRITRLEVVNAFPGTHHFETFALLVPAT